MTKSERVALRRDIRRRGIQKRQHHLGTTTTRGTSTMSSTLQIGDRVQMDPEYTFLGVPVGDLGTGTVIATEDDSLLSPFYVLVEWDENHGTLAERPAAAALVKVEDES